MNIYQIVSKLSYGDGVGNDILAIDALLKRNGYRTGIYAPVIDGRIPAGLAKPFREIPGLSRNDIVILHLAVGSDVNRWFQKQCRCRKILCYHNITPAAFFEPYSPQSAAACRDGLAQVRELRGTPQLCIADSRFNKEDLLRLGYRMEIEVIPILIPFEDYDREPDRELMKRYDDGMTNILFTGRIVPNKKQEDVILAFYYYQKYYNPDSRLFLVGSYQGMEAYYRRLLEYVRRLGVKNVVFTGHIGFASVLSYYRLADAFVCMSEHEGFCIPLLEAMHFQVPIVACDFAAAGGTMGQGGILLKEKDPLLAAGCIHEILGNERLRSRILQNQKRELANYSADAVGKKFMDSLERFIRKR